MSNTGNRSMAAICGRAASRWAGSRSENVQTYLVWEHFSENDDRMRTAKQLCKTDPGPASVPAAYPVSAHRSQLLPAISRTIISARAARPTSLYSADVFEVPNGVCAALLRTASGTDAPDPVRPTPAQSSIPMPARCNREICARSKSTLNPQYKAKNDTLELNADYNITPSLTFTSQTGYNQDFLWSTEDYNRFDTAEGAFRIYDACSSRALTPIRGSNALALVTPDPNGLGRCADTAVGDACVGLAAGMSVHAVSRAPTSIPKITC